MIFYYANRLTYSCRQEVEKMTIQEIAQIIREREAGQGGLEMELDCVGGELWSEICACEKVIQFVQGQNFKDLGVEEQWEKLRPFILQH